MLRRLLPIAFCALLACAALQASPLTVYFTGVCTDCVGTGAGGTVNASITFATGYFYNVVGQDVSTNLAYGIDQQNPSIASFVYGGSNKQAAISTTAPFSTFVNFGWEGLNPFPGAQSVALDWGNPSGISYSFDTVLNSLSTSGDWSFSVTNNGGGGRQIQDTGTNASWSFNAPPPSPVPEPTTWLEMAGGLGLLGILGAAGKLKAVQG